MNPKAGHSAAYPPSNSTSGRLPAPLRILLADSHAPSRNGLRALIEAETDMAVIDEVDQGAVALEHIRTMQPDIALVDIHLSMLGGIEIVEGLAELKQRSQIIAISLYPDNSFISGLLVAGASGYVLRESLLEEGLAAIRAVSQGLVYLSPVPYCGTLHALMRLGLTNCASKREAQNAS